MRDQCPEFMSEPTELVADSYNILRGHVNDWLRKKDSILRSAKTKDAKQTRERTKRDRFAEVENNVYE